MKPCIEFTLIMNSVSFLVFPIRLYCAGETIGKKTLQAQAKSKHCISCAVRAQSCSRPSCAPRRLRSRAFRKSRDKCRARVLTIGPLRRRISIVVRSPCRRCAIPSGHLLCTELRFLNLQGLRAYPYNSFSTLLIYEMTHFFSICNFSCLFLRYCAAFTQTMKVDNHGSYTTVKARPI